MRESARRSAARSTIVVLVAAASGYLIWRLIALPFMEKAQVAFEKSQEEASSADDVVSHRGNDDWESVELKPVDGYFKDYAAFLMEERLAGMSLTILQCNSVEPLRKHGFRILLFAMSSNSKFSREHPKVHDQDLNIWSLHQRVCSDSREKVTAHCQLICPTKREFMEFGRFKQPGTFLPKASKGRMTYSSLIR